MISIFLFKDAKSLELNPSTNKKTLGKFFCINL